MGKKIRYHEGENDKVLSINTHWVLIHFWVVLEDPSHGKYFYLVYQQENAVCGFADAALLGQDFC